MHHACRTKPPIFSFGRDDADEVLRAPAIDVGTYLFRTSKTFARRRHACAGRNVRRGTFALSMKMSSQEVSHFQISKNLDGRFEFGATKHPSLLELELFLLQNQKAGLSVMRTRFE